MSGEGYLALGYTVALGLLWGYAMLIWLRRRSLRRHRASRPPQHPR
jgi:hypothetical protein